MANENIPISAAKFAMDLKQFIQENEIEYNRVSENEILIFISNFDLGALYNLLLKDVYDFSESGLNVIWKGDYFAVEITQILNYVGASELVDSIFPTQNF